jgi:hypothetical protein
MMNRKRVGIVLVLIAVLVGGYFFKKHRNYSGVLKANPVLQGEYEKLVNSNDPSVVRRVILVLKDHEAPEALKEALAHLNDSNPEMRAVVAEILCTYPFEGQVKESIQRLIRDPELKVRLRAIQFLGQRTDGERLSFLKEHCAQVSEAEEKDMCQYGLFRLAKTGDDQKVLLDQAMSGMDPATLTWAKVVNLVGMAPKDPRLVLVFLKKIETAKSGGSEEDSRLLDRIYRHLAIYAPESIRDQFANFVVHPVAAIRNAALMTASQLCPKDRWAVIRKVATSKNSPDEMQKGALNAARMLGGKRAFELAHEMKEEWAREVPERTPEADSCDRAAGIGMPGRPVSGLTPPKNHTNTRR